MERCLDSQFYGPIYCFLSQREEGFLFKELDFSTQSVQSLPMALPQF